MPDATLGVIDQRENSRFVYVEDGIEAELTYIVEEGRLILDHTGVPEELGGRGIAARLVRAAIDRARTTGETVAPWCRYARRWIEGHPDEVEGVAIDWSEPEGE